MPKTSASYEIALPHRNPATPAYQWLYDAVRSEILAGRLRPGTRLPASRDLARQYSLSRGTIVNAFDQLASEGYISGSVGSGTFVSRTLPEHLLHVVAPNVASKVAPAKRPPHISHYSHRAERFPCYENKPIRAFRPNLPALDLFPIALWTKITTRCLRRISARNLMGCDTFGFTPLRRAIAEYLSRSRGVRCSPEQVAIVSGVQEALDLTARVLLNSGDRVCVEDPGYTGAVLAFRAIGAKASAAGVDEEGIVVQKLPTRGVRLIYITPAHQFPMGTTTTLARRLQLLEWARKSGALILEDDYDSEYRYSGRPIPALQGLDQHGMVLYAGSFSKVLFPALRLGYLVLPPPLVAHFEAALTLTVRHAPILEQIVLTEFIADGHFSRHVRRMREIYGERLSVLLEEARSRLAGLLDLSNIEAGLQTLGWLNHGLSGISAATAAATRNIDVIPLEWYCQRSPARSGLQLGFAAFDPKELRRGVRELAIALTTEYKIPRRTSRIK